MHQVLDNLDFCDLFGLRHEFKHRICLVGQTNVDADLVLDGGHLGGLLLISKQVRSDLLEVFEPRFRNAVVPPLRNRPGCYVA